LSPTHPSFFLSPPSYIFSLVFMLRGFETFFSVSFISSGLFSSRTLGFFFFTLKVKCVREPSRVFSAPVTFFYPLGTPTNWINPKPPFSFPLFHHFFSASISLCRFMHQGLILFPPPFPLPPTEFTRPVFGFFNTPFSPFKVKPPRP